jgi:transcriptional regulator with XRE-family HTH domain
MSDKSTSKIGRRIRLLRLQQNRNQDEIADSCGFSVSLLSKIETGKVIPSIGTLVKIANSLGTNVSSFIEDGSSTNIVYTPKNTSMKNAILTAKGLSIYPFAAEHKNKKMQPFLLKAKKGEVKEHADSHEGQEFIFVLKGKLNLRIVDAEYLLNEGDSIFFDCLEEHECTPVTEEAEYLDIFV